MIVVAGATGRLGRFLKTIWGDRGTRWLGREVGATDLEGARAVLDLRGVRPGQGELQANLRLAEEILQAAKQAVCGRVFLASSAAVYGRLTGPLTEDQAAPESAYGQVKRQMEQVAAAQDHPVTCLRIGNVAGADAILGGHTPGFSLHVLHDGRTPERSYIGPETFARVLHTLTLREDLPPRLNVAAPGVVAMGALLDAAGLPWRPDPAPETVIERVHLDTTLLEQYVAFDTRDSTPEGLVGQWHRICRPS